jgi:biotin-(acetyl-CoA carboxylase) ligase
MKRYARQLENKDEIVKYEKLLDEALIMFGVCLPRYLRNGHFRIVASFIQVSLQISIHRRLTILQRETSERHGEVLDVSRITDSEREVRWIDQ